MVQMKCTVHLMRKQKVHVSSYISNLGSVIDDETKHLITYG